MTPALHLARFAVAEWPGAGTFALPSVLVVAGISSVAIVGLGVAALSQRRSRSYLLITLALATLLVRTLVGGLALEGMLSMHLHHLIEHASDGVMAVLLLAAVYFARTANPRSDEDTI
ncbi:hypothetical protein [Halococcus sp. IIIV-5B]|uniref:DUF7471 family protein n=1 Tax=Halococcus sp. IIIV-5B TaxID=2321230 RepID=UPI000E74B4CB|nr:hypothetical protein [Halococcus sp. IIIV-5B]RJT03158.1 hypothetical protein D3261_11790 [Halococcus sp. IIIV-5B]